jgi:hypothetical protein
VLCCGDASAPSWRAAQCRPRDFSDLGDCVDRQDIGAQRSLAETFTVRRWRKPGCPAECRWRAHGRVHPIGLSYPTLASLAFRQPVDEAIERGGASYRKPSRRNSRSRPVGLRLPRSPCAQDVFCGTYQTPPDLSTTTARWRGRGSGRRSPRRRLLLDPTPPTASAR